MGLIEDHNFTVTHFLITVVDAVRSDAIGHAGRVLCLGHRREPTFVKSIEQKLVSRSSTESELIGLTESAAGVLFQCAVLKFPGIPQKPSVIYQDNRLTTMMAGSGRGETASIFR